MSQIDVLHAQAHLRSLPPDRRATLVDPAHLALELAQHDISTLSFTDDDWRILQAEVAGGGAVGERQAVAPPLTVMDSRGDLQQQVQEVLDTDQRIRDWSIDALVTGSVVTLTGMVRKTGEKRLVEEIVRAIPGVTSVINDVTIR